MPWMVLLHSAFMSVWFAGLIALPRLLAQHARTEDASTREWLLGFERQMFKMAMTPAAILTVVSGFWLLFSHGFEGGWMPVKLLFVTVLALLHLYQGRLLARFHGTTRVEGRMRFAVLATAAFVAGVIIIVLVVGEPF